MTKTKSKRPPQESPDPVKITLRLDPRLVQWAKILAVQTGSTVQELVEVALVNYLKSHGPDQELDARLMEFATQHRRKR